MAQVLTIIKEGPLVKEGGSLGGNHNWKNRFSSNKLRNHRNSFFNTLFLACFQMVCFDFNIVVILWRSNQKINERKDCIIWVFSSNLFSQVSSQNTEHLWPCVIKIGRNSSHTVQKSQLCFQFDYALTQILHARSKSWNSGTVGKCHQLSEIR